jgi:hypothetical protein
MANSAKDHLHGLIRVESTDTQVTETYEAETDAADHTAENANLSRNTFKVAESRGWLFSSSSSSSSLGSLALKAEDLTDERVITSQIQSPSSLQLDDSDSSPSPTLGSASQKKIAPPFTILKKEAEMQNSTKQLEPTDIVRGRLPEPIPSHTGSGSSLVGLAREEELTRPSLREKSDVRGSRCNDVAQTAYHSSQSRFIAHVLRNATPLGRYMEGGIAWEDVQFYPIIMEEEDGPSESIVRSSSSHDSLFALDSDEFEYAEVCFPSQIKIDVC